MLLLDGGIAFSELHIDSNEHRDTNSSANKPTNCRLNNRRGMRIIGCCLPMANVFKRENEKKTICRAISMAGTHCST